MRQCLALWEMLPMLLQLLKLSSLRLGKLGEGMSLTDSTIVIFHCMNICMSVIWKENIWLTVVPKYTVVGFKGDLWTAGIITLLWVCSFICIWLEIAVTGGIMLLGCLSICPSVWPIHVNVISQNALRNFFRTWHKLPSGLKDKLISLVIVGQKSRSLWPQNTHFL